MNETPQGRSDSAADRTPGFLASWDEKRRLLLLVRTGLTLAIGYLLIFSTRSAALPPTHLLFVVTYLASNIVVAIVPARILASAWFDVLLVLADTTATSFALFLMPQANTDVFVFYFVIVLLASMSDRVATTVLAPIVTSLAYFAFLVARHGFRDVMEPEILLRLPFFLLAGAFYGFFVDRVRREQIAAAAARQREQARTEFLSLITHDFKQPLWVAQHSASSLYDRLIDEESRTLAAQVIVSLRRMEALTANFLDFGRIESKAVRIFPQKALINRILADLIASYRPAFELKGVEVVVSFDPAVPAARADAAQLQRAVANLIDNAVKYTPKGGRIFVETALRDGAIEICVGDTGAGIPAGREADLFTRYQSGRSTEERRSTGLGLYIARAIVAAHGGEIGLAPSRPVGAWFRIRLPVDGAQAQPVSARPTSADNPPSVAA